MVNSSHELSDSLNPLDVGAGDGEPGNEGPWIDPDNPMLNDLVLESLFHYIHGNDLKTCRLVCRKWSVLTVPFSRSRLRVTIWGSDPNNSEQARGIVNFVKLIESNTLGIPFGRFRLGSFDTTTGPGQRFLELCGKTAKEFWLDRSGDHVVENISVLLESAPKLESFVMPLSMTSKCGGLVRLFPGQVEGQKPNLQFLKCLDTSADYQQKRLTICPTFYEELFGVAENISTVFITGWHRASHLRLDVLASLENLGSQTKIENLKLMDVDEKHFEILERIVKKLKLKKLELMVSREIGTMDWFQVVNLFKNTLTCLSINSMACSPTVITFPPMPNLKELKLEIPDPLGLQSLCCQNQNFSSTFPVLEKLHILRFGFRLNDNLFMNFTSCQKDSPAKAMKSLVLRHDMDIQILDHICAVFPNLTKFECRVNSFDGVHVIHRICTHMTQLEGLTISGILHSSINLDSLLTGIPDIDMKKMKIFLKLVGEKSTSVDSRQEIISSRGIGLRKIASIHNLQNLKSLNIRLRVEKGRDEMNFLTELTGYFGLYSLKNLRHLSVCNCLISKTCSEILVKDKELMSWRFKSVSDEEIIPSNWKYTNEY